MTPVFTLTDIATNPAILAQEVQAPDRSRVTFRPLVAGDSARLGRYFCGLSQDTISRYGPHPFDQATADKLCAEIDYNAVMRMIAVRQSPAGEEIIAYFILQPGIPADEQERYVRAGVRLDPKAGCLIAPSVADAWQNRGLGTPLMRRIFEIARGLGYKHVVLMGGVYLTNERAVHYYRKLGFRDIGVTFENPPGSGRVSFDMYVNL